MKTEKLRKLHTLCFFVENAICSKDDSIHIYGLRKKKKKEREYAISLT